MAETDIRPVRPLPSSGGNGPPLTVLSEADFLRGHLEMRGDGHLMGSFQGEIECGGELLVGPDARVNANVRAMHVTISGLVAGNLVARGRLKITATGQLRGDAEVASLIVQEGGVHFGGLRVHPAGVPETASDQPEPAPTPPAGGTKKRVESHSAAGSAGRPLTGSVDRVKRLWGELF